MTIRQRLTAEGLPIGDTKQIRALASPLRQDIMDAVTAIGPCSVSQLAAAVGRPADGLYYHVRRLLKVGLLAASDVSEGPRGELRVDVAHKAFYLKYEPGSRTNRAAVSRVVGSMVRSAERAFRRGFRSGSAVVKGARRNLWAGRAQGALSPEDLVQVNLLLHRLIALMRSGRSDRARKRGASRRLHELTFVLAPGA